MHRYNVIKTPNVWFIIVYIPVYFHTVWLWPRNSSTYTSVFGGVRALQSSKQYFQKRNIDSTKNSDTLDRNQKSQSNLICDTCAIFRTLTLYLVGKNYTTQTNSRLHLLHLPLVLVNFAFRFPSHCLSVCLPGVEHVNLVDVFLSFIQKASHPDFGHPWHVKRNNTIQGVYVIYMRPVNMDGEVSRKWVVYREFLYSVHDFRLNCITQPKVMFFPLSFRNQFFPFLVLYSFEYPYLAYCRSEAIVLLFLIFFVAKIPLRL